MWLAFRVPWVGDLPSLAHDIRNVWYRPLDHSDRLKTVAAVSDIESGSTIFLQRTNPTPVTAAVVYSLAPPGLLLTASLVLRTTLRRNSNRVVTSESARSKAASTMVLRRAGSTSAGVASSTVSTNLRTAAPTVGPHGDVGAGQLVASRS